MLERRGPERGRGGLLLGLLAHPLSSRTVLWDLPQAAHAPRQGGLVRGRRAPCPGTSLEGLQAVLDTSLLPLC